MNKNKGKIIRDVVHGDIFIEPKYLAIIDAKEFQRLRRIKQLSVANMVFPGAEHTRFAHCVGTFYIMEKIIEHFEPIFQKCGLGGIESREKEAALAAALLHDIGHGPYSHAFEGVLKSQGYEDMTHEQMSAEIIRDEQTEVHKALSDWFGKDFPELVSDIILKKKEVKSQPFEYSTDRPDLQFVLSSLLSSQLDADRMDYMLRDSWYTGAKYGAIDLSRTISSMSLAIHPATKQFCVCVLGRYLVDIENALLGRYQMHKEVYYHSFKCEMEQVIKKILSRAKDLYMTGKLEHTNMLPEPIKKMFEAKKLSVQEYVLLDDNILYTLFWNWMASKDPELSFLCNTLINRNKYSKLPMKSKEDISNFKKELAALLRDSKYEAEVEGEAFLLTVKDKLNMYKIAKENIFIQDEFGNLSDIHEVSKVLNFKETEEKNYIFINYDLIKAKFKDEIFLEKVRSLVKKYKSRNQIEREAKYTVDSPDVWEAVKNAIVDMNGYVIKEKGTKEQSDSYYDTKDEVLGHSDITLRIRTIENQHWCTLKMPVAQALSAKQSSHSVRYEYEEEVKGDSIQDCYGFYSNKSKVFENIRGDQLRPSLVVRNHREKFDIRESSDPSIRFEMVFDDVEYINTGNGKSVKDYQVEIELKSEYLHEVRLHLLTDHLEKVISKLNINRMSKYKRGLLLTQ